MHKPWIYERHKTRDVIGHMLFNLKSTLIYTANSEVQ